MASRDERDDGAAKNEQSNQLKSYPFRWKGQVLLVCSKCERKVRHIRPRHPGKRIKKVLKQCATEDEQGFHLRVLNISCLKLCPKGGVTVCTQAQLARNECSIVRTVEEIEQLYEECRRRWSSKTLECPGPAAIIQDGGRNYL